MTVWALGAHWMQKTTWFQASVTNREIDLFTYPTLTKRPAEIALPGFEWQQVKTLYYMTCEHIGTIKLILNIFVLKSDKNEIFFNLKITPKKYDLF